MPSDFSSIRKKKQFKLLIICFTLILSTVLIGGCGQDSSSSASSKQSNTVPVISAEEYQEAINLAKQGKWHECGVKLVTFHNDDEKCQVLYDYACAQ